jgi:hypothetical protein
VVYPVFVVWLVALITVMITRSGMGSSAPQQPRGKK